MAIDTDISPEVSDAVDSACDSGVLVGDINNITPTSLTNTETDIKTPTATLQKNDVKVNNCNRIDNDSRNYNGTADDSGGNDDDGGGDSGGGGGEVEVVKVNNCHSYNNTARRSTKKKFCYGNDDHVLDILNDDLIARVRDKIKSKF